MKLVLLAFFIYRLVFLFNPHHSTTKQLSCFNIGLDLNGTEDAYFDRSSETLYISSMDFSSSNQGKLYQYKTHLKQLELPSDYQLYPHGISMVDSYLMVVNHLPSGDAVDVLKIDQNKAYLYKRYQSKNMVSLNDVHAVSKDTFYATNDHSLMRHPLLSFMLDLVGIPTASVIYFKDGQDQGQIVSYLDFANGIYFDQVNQLLYVSETLKKRINVYDTNYNIIKQFTFPTFVDNLDMDDDGVLWVASHSNLLKFFGHMMNKQYASPSQVYKIKDEPELVYSDDQLSAMSTAIRYKNRLFVTSVHSHMMECELD